MIHIGGVHMANLTQKNNYFYKIKKVMKNCALKIYKLCKSIKGSSTKTNILNNAQEEQEHLNSINQILSGQFQMLIHSK